MSSLEINNNSSLDNLIIPLPPSEEHSAEVGEQQSRLSRIVAWATPYLGSMAIATSKTTLGKRIFTTGANYIAQRAYPDFIDQEVENPIELDEVAIRDRRVERVPLPEEIKKAVTKLGHTAAYLVSMKLIDRVFSSKDPQDFYATVFSMHISDKEIEKAFFQHLDQSGLFFLTRWIAKIAYRILFPLVNRGFFDVTPVFAQRLQADLYENFSLETYDEKMVKLRSFLEDWKKVLRNVRPEAERILHSNEGIEEEIRKKIDAAFEKELSKPEYNAGMIPDEFYKKIVKKLIASYYVDISLGKIIYDKLLNFKIPTPFQETLSRTSLERVFAQILGILLDYLTLSIKLALFPFLVILRLILLLPEYALNRWLPGAIEKAILDNFSIYLNQTLEQISTRRGFSVPVLEELNDSLEDLLLQIRENELISEETPTWFLEESNRRKILQENVTTLIETGELYKRVKEVEEMEEPQTSNQMWRWVRETADSKIESTIQEVVKTKEFGETFARLWEKATNARFLNRKFYNIVTQLNQSLINPNSVDDQKFDELTDRFYSLMHEIVHLIVLKELQERGILEGKAHKIISKRVFDAINTMLNVVSSPHFVKLASHAVLKDFFDLE